jgi:hypothetical protein
LVSVKARQLAFEEKTSRRLTVVTSHVLTMYYIGIKKNMLYVLAILSGQVEKAHLSLDLLYKENESSQFIFSQFLHLNPSINFSPFLFDLNIALYL